MAVNRLCENRKVGAKVLLAALTAKAKLMQETGQVAKLRAVGCDVRRQHIGLVLAIEVAALVKTMLPPES
eukprot:5523492-Pleurochrysis_carterae.AAC.1